MLVTWLSSTSIPEYRNRKIVQNPEEEDCNC